MKFLVASVSPDRISSYVVIRELSKLKSREFLETFPTGSGVGGSRLPVNEKYENVYNIYLFLNQTTRTTSLEVIFFLVSKRESFPQYSCYVCLFLLVLTEKVIIPGELINHCPFLFQYITIYQVFLGVIC